MIEASVTLPLFRSQYIAWLQLESLCRQQDVNFDWELLIAEEQGDETFGIKRINEYRDRLQNVGCVRIIYKPLEKWIHLGMKFKLLFESASPSSKLCFRSAGDIYSMPQRLRRLMDLHKEHPEGDYFVPATSLIYDIKTGIAVMRDLEKMKLPEARMDDVVGIAIATDLARKAMNLFEAGGKMVTATDSAIWAYCKKVKSPKGLTVIRDWSDMWRYGLNTHGLNNVSDRRALFIQPKSPNLLMVPYPYDLSETIPRDILERLRECVKFLPLHKAKLPMKGPPC